MPNVSPQQRGRYLGVGHGEEAEGRVGVAWWQCVVGARVCKGFYERTAAGVLEGGADRDASR